MTAPPFDRAGLARDLAVLAGRNLYVGTSSWKYPGWVGQIYDGQRYDWRGKFSVSRFDKHCLEEYAAVFKTVCVDAGYYRFPTPEYLESLVSRSAIARFCIPTTSPCSPGMASPMSSTNDARFRARKGNRSDAR